MKKQGILVWTIIDHSLLLSITILIDYYGRHQSIHECVYVFVQSVHYCCPIPK